MLSKPLVPVPSLAHGLGYGLRALGHLSNMAPITGAYGHSAKSSRRNKEKGQKQSLADVNTEAVFRPVSRKMSDVDILVIA
jgi:hypothetical protein